MSYIIASYSIDKPFAWGGRDDGPFASKDQAVEALKQEDLSRFNKSNHHHMGRCVATLKKKKNESGDVETVATIIVSDRDLELRSDPYELPTE